MYIHVSVNTINDIHKWWNIITDAKLRFMKSIVSLVCSIV
jgi:hypothetical protein